MDMQTFATHDATDTADATVREDAATDGAVTLIPLSRLRPSSLNVRRMAPDRQGLAQLAASIRSVGLLQSLVVTPEGDGYGVVAGARRLQAMQKLVKGRKLQADHPVPCRVVTREQATEISLSENVHREAMHPADEYEAWAKLADEGMSIEDIAARHGVKPDVVKRRLLLARVSPKVMRLFREGKLKLDQVMAFTLTDDHGAQDALLAGRDYYPSAHEIRRVLAERMVSASDARARFVGEAAYLAAGGTLKRDLFDERGGTYFLDVDVLNRLVTQKLEETASSLRDRYAWVEVHPAILDYSRRDDFCTIPSRLDESDTDAVERWKALQAELVAAQERLDAIESDPDEEQSDRWEAAHQEVERLEEAIENIETQLRKPDPAYAEVAGMVVALDFNGELLLYGPVARKADMTRVRKAAAAANADAGAGELAVVQSIEPLAVQSELTSFLTAIAQEALAENPEMALRALAYQLALGGIERAYAGLGLDISAQDHASLPCENAFADTAIQQERLQRRSAWAADVPQDGAKLWDWCLSIDTHTLHSFLAYSIARSLNGVVSYPGAQQRMVPLLRALKVDVRKHWKPTAAFFGRLKKASILQVLADQGIDVKGLDKLKRDQLARKAEDLLADSGWLPPSLTF